MTRFKENIKNWDFSEEAILKRTQNCSRYFNAIPSLCSNKNMILFESVQMKDIKTAMAFNIMAHLHPGIFELFLALYFRPNDHFVIHLDKKVMMNIIEIFVCSNYISQRSSLMYNDYAKTY